MANEYYLAIDIGATNTRIAIGSRNGIINKITYRTPREGNELSIPVKIYEEIKKNYGKYIDQIKAVGIGTIGPIDLRRGRVVNTPNLPIHTFELRDPLMEWLKKPVYVLNDAVSGAWGEKFFGLGRNYSNIVYITMSTGIGGGAIVNDHLLLGKMGNAHEIGHIVVKYDSDIKCGCGGYGHWEAYAGGANIPRTARVLAEKYKPLIETEAYREALRGELTPPKLFEYFRRNDLFAKYVVEEIIDASAAGLATTINLYDPEVVTIGGSIYLYNQDILKEPIIRKALKHLVTEPPIIDTTPLGGDIVLYGALATAINPPEDLLRFYR
ncbi:glucokinase [Staphylothermus marinus F1]|uniref:Glucokinase n=1 Tax=Staphylothermus marinus (strain ATCC 43588 / DSM 3639 / JCM 9404 / F1) TaxID=399550 RepID=A3DPP3_STAMF|nr:ROK family protein [Staphylothermus marinus]ABN70603.1 glucokinase [Staphylothermus marinus F1]